MAADYLKRYESDDPGLRFQELVYTGNFIDMEPVPDGILGDRIMKSRAQSSVLERVDIDAVRADEFSIAELNDLNNYLAWNIWDVLVMRATEGASGMIPRQEYELLARMHEFYRWPELLRMTTDEIGAQGVMDLGASSRNEVGTKINAVHDWCIGAVGFGMGRCALLALEAIGADDYIEESSTILKFMQRVLWGKRQDGWILNSQNRYRCQIHTQELIDRLLPALERFDESGPDHDALIQFSAAAELLSFLDHFDCRLGLGDTGPYPLPNGNLLIIRDLFCNEDAYHWSDVCDHEGVPHCYTVLLEIGANGMGLEEIRVNDISTTFTRPKNYIPHVVAGAIFVREKWNTPMTDVYPVPIAELGPRLTGIQNATFKLYTKLSRMCRRQLITNGMYVYYVGMILPHLRRAETYEKACTDFDFWEIDQRSSEYYYQIGKRDFAQVTVPNKIFSGSGYLPFSAGADRRRSKYFWG